MPRGLRSSCRLPAPPATGWRRAFRWRSVFDLHLFQVHLKLFGDQHRDRGIGALSHLDIGHGQDNPPVAYDADEGVGRKTIGIGRFGFAVCERQAEAKHQASARGHSSLQEPAPRNTVR